MDFNNLVGKTIIKVTKMKRPDFDDEGWLKLEFSDKSECTLVSTYNNFTGGSEGEYPCNIFIVDKYEDKLIPIT